jgi:dienelactone hydrolase
MSPAVTQFVQMGGMVAAQAKTTTTGTNTGDNVWYTGDVATADEVVACAIQNQKIDPRRIHVGGYSAGGLQTTYQWFARSGYVASVMTYSGGDTAINKAPMQDPSHVPPALVTHGGAGKDTFIIDFAQTSATWETDIKGMGGFAIDCDDGGAHTDILNRAKIAPNATQFFLDHPYGVKPEPYTAIPSGWPSYCKIVSP